MNKYIRKCLIIYVSITAVFCSMVGIAYAVTATDANRFVTRSKYAVDMTYLQTKLDEAESSLIGKINKYRATDVKLTTWDTPDYTWTYSSAHMYNGEYTGGNFFPRYRKNTTSDYIYSHGQYQKGYDKITSNRRNNLILHRLWNGNYYIGCPVSGKESINDDTATEYYQTPLCALPVEDLPGWYLVLGAWRQAQNYIPWNIGFVKLDPNVPYVAGEYTKIRDSWHTVRLKKDLWMYCSAGVNKLPVGPNSSTWSASSDYIENATYLGVFNMSYISSVSRTTTYTVQWKGYEDKETGDYILSFYNLRPNCPSAGEYEFVYNYEGQNCLLNRFIPRDNVEYMMGSFLYGYSNRAQSKSSPLGTPFPNPTHIGDGLSVDPYWEYEFVDCVNGIKYWHAVKRATDVKKGTFDPPSMTVHYSLPIVY